MTVAIARTRGRRLHAAGERVVAREERNRTAGLPVPVTRKLPSTNNSVHGTIPLRTKMTPVPERQVPDKEPVDHMRVIQIRRSIVQSRRVEVKRRSSRRLAAARRYRGEGRIVRSNIHRA